MVTQAARATPPRAMHAVACLRVQLATHCALSETPLTAFGTYRDGHGIGNGDGCTQRLSLGLPAGHQEGIRIQHTTFTLSPASERCAWACRHCEGPVWSELRLRRDTRRSCQWWVADLCIRRLLATASSKNSMSSPLSNEREMGSDGCPWRAVVALERVRTLPRGRVHRVPCHAARRRPSGHTQRADRPWALLKSVRLRACGLPCCCRAASRRQRRVVTWQCSHEQCGPLQRTTHWSPKSPSHTDAPAHRTTGPPTHPAHTKRGWRQNWLHLRLSLEVASKAAARANLGRAVFGNSPSSKEGEPAVAGRAVGRATRPTRHPTVAPPRRRLRRAARASEARGECHTGHTL